MIPSQPSSNLSLSIRSYINCVKCEPYLCHVYSLPEWKRLYEVQYDVWLRTSIEEYVCSYHDCKCHRLIDIQRNFWNGLWKNGFKIYSNLYVAHNYNSFRILFPGKYLVLTWYSLTIRFQKGFKNLIFISITNIDFWNLRVSEQFFCVYFLWMCFGIQKSINNPSNEYKEILIIIITKYHWWMYY